MIGRFLALELCNRGEEVYVYSRKKQLPALLENTEIFLVSSQEPTEYNLDGLDVIVNLAGDPIVGSRWTDAKKSQIRSSRVDYTKKLVEKLSHTQKKPKLLINGSAIGYYGLFQDGSIVHKENSSPNTNDYLSNLCIEWEKEALEAEKLGIRVVLLRTGIVLSAEGGALQQMLLPFKLFVGGPIASGKQFTSWIHIDDMIKAIIFLMDDPNASGAYNLTAPIPVSNEKFSKTLAKTLSRPNLFRVPSFALDLMFGQGSTILIQGQNVVPQKLLDSGFEFQYKELETALKNLLHK